MHNDVVKFGLKLFLISAIAGLALGATNAVTAGPIQKQQIAEANAARMSVLPAASDFSLISEADGDVADLYAGVDASGATVGYTGKAVVNGFGGPIEVTVGMDNNGVITGVNVGGTDFSETAGLGARTKEPWFGAQYAGRQAPVALTKDGGEIDAVTSATISSTAVTNGVNIVSNTLLTLIGEGK